jgi:hypothetical protein
MITVIVIIAIAAVLIWIRSLPAKPTDVHILAEMPCPECEKCVGQASAKAACEAYLRHNRETIAANPGVMFRLSPIWTITCANCQREFKFNYQKKAILPQGVDF